MAQNYTQGYLNEIQTDIQSKIDTDFTHMGFGTGTVTPTELQTALDSEVVRRSRQDYSTTVDSAITGFFLPSTTANGNDISEVGVFDASSGGSMKLRATLNTPITKTSDVEIWADVTNKNTITDNS